MILWPADVASRVADGVSVLAFVGSVATGIYSKLRGNAVDRKVRELRRDFERRDLLPSTARRYQKLYRELVPLLVLGIGADPRPLLQKSGEMRGILKSLDSYLSVSEKQTIKILADHLGLLDKAPTDQDHSQAVLSSAATLSVELEVIVERIKWNSQS